MNLSIISGRLTKDAKLLFTSSGKTYCISSLAVREDRKPNEKQTTFVDFIIWGQRAERLCSMLTKGKPISITGRLEISRSTKNDKTYINPRIVVDTLEFLSRKETSVIDKNIDEPAEK